jgi:universal stress protein A
MLNFIPTHDEGNTLAIRASGKLNHKDYQAFLPKLEEKIKQYGQISLLLELDNFSGWDTKAAKDDFKFGFKHMGDLDRIAIVGDKAWEHWMTMMAKPFMLLGKVRYFDRERLQEAWDWLREKENLEEAAETLLPYKSILVPVDYSLASIHACKRGIELAKQYDAKLNLLHVTQQIPLYDSTMFPLDGGGWPIDYHMDYELTVKKEQQQLELAKEQMKRFVSQLDSDCDIDTEVSSGDISNTILSYLEAQKTDLVIFGSKRKRGIKKHLGSIPNHIQNNAHCELLVIPLVVQNSDVF